MNVVAISANTSWYIYNFRRTTIEALIRNGYSVFAIAPQDQYSERLVDLGVEFVHIDIDQGGTNPLKDLKTLINFCRIYSTLNLSVVLNFTPKNNIYSTLAASFFKIPVVNNISGLGVVFSQGGVTASIVKRLYQVSQSRADHIFFQNVDDQSQFLNYGFINESRTSRIPGSGVDLVRFKHRDFSEDGTLRLLMVCRMLKEKGVAEFVEAARILTRRYSNLEFNLLGFVDGNNPSSISSETMHAWQSEGAVNYLGVSNEVEVEIARSACIVLPSYYREGVPKALLEGAAMGKPLVTTDNIGCRDAVDDGLNGFLCEMRSVNDLVEKLDMVISMSSEEWKSMGHLGRLKMEREFDDNIIINEYLRIIDSVVRC